MHFEAILSNMVQVLYLESWTTVLSGSESECLVGWLGARGLDSPATGGQRAASGAKIAGGGHDLNAEPFKKVPCALKKYREATETP